MANPARGFGAFLGVGEEATWGDAVARTNWMKVVSWSGKRTIVKQRRPHLGCANSTSTMSRNHYTSTDQAGGALEIVAAYDDTTLMLMKYCTGTVATTGAGPFQHDFTLEIPRDPANVSLTFEAGLGTVDSEVFEGCLVDSWTFAITSGDVARLSVNYIGETSGGLVAQGTPVFSSNGESILHSHAGQLSFAGIDMDITSLSITVTKSLSRRHLLGSELTQEPVPGDFATGEVSFVIEYGQTTGLNAAWLADTQGDGTITFMGTGNNRLEITLQNLYIMDVGRPITTAGIVTQTVTAMVESDGTNEGISFDFRNDNASSDAN